MHKLSTPPPPGPCGELTILNYYYEFYRVKLFWTNKRKYIFQIKEKIRAYQILYYPK